MRPVRPSIAVRRDARGDELPQVAEIQRQRILVAAVQVIAEHGYGAASVVRITERAGVSRRTFYELFQNREQCAAAILTSTEQRLAHQITVAVEHAGSWRARVRAGLWVILCVFEREPALGRVCLVESSSGQPLVLAERERIIERLTSIVDEGRDEGARASVAGPLTAQGTVAAVIALIQAQLGGREHFAAARNRGAQRLGGLLGELMAIVVLPYLGAAAARRERTRPTPAAAGSNATNRRLIHEQDALAGMPVRLTYRTIRALLAVADLDRHRSGLTNAQIAERAGITDAGQASKLLARLERHGLIANATSAAKRKSDANRWALTPTGQTLIHSIETHTTSQRQAA